MESLPRPQKKEKIQMKKETICAICESVIYPNSQSVEYSFQIRTRDDDELSVIKGEASICSVCMSKGDDWVADNLSDRLRRFVECDESVAELFGKETQ